MTLGEDSLFVRYDCKRNIYKHIEKWLWSGNEIHIKSVYWINCLHLSSGHQRDNMSMIFMLQGRVGKFLTLVVKTSGFWRLLPSCQKQVFGKNMSKTSKTPHEQFVLWMKNTLFYIRIKLLGIRSLIVISECWLEYTLFIQRRTWFTVTFEMGSKWAQLTHARVIDTNCCIQ